MNLAGIRNDNGRVFESQNYYTNKEKDVIQQAVLQDAESSKLEITIREMTNDELSELMSQ